MELAGIQGLKGTVSVPGDKSISHRCIMFGSIANGTTEIHNFLKGADCLATIRCFQSMGINIEETDHTITVHGKGLHGLSAPLNILDVGNSGTTTRLLSGILAGQKFESKLSGRRVFKLPPYETDHRTAYNDGRKYFKYSQKRMRSAVHRSGKSARNPLRFPRLFRTGEIMYPACRIVRRRRNFGYRTVAFQEPH